MGAGRNIGLAFRGRRVLGDLTGIFIHLQELEIIISLNKKYHGIHNTFICFQSSHYVTLKDADHNRRPPVTLCIFIHYSSKSLFPEDDKSYRIKQ